MQFTWINLQFTDTYTRVIMCSANKLKFITINKKCNSCSTPLKHNLQILSVSGEYGWLLMRFVASIQTTLFRQQYSRHICILLYPRTQAGVKFCLIWLCTVVTDGVGKLHQNVISTELWLVYIFGIILSVSPVIVVLT